MKWTNFLNDKRTWAPADEGAPSGDVDDTAPETGDVADVIVETPTDAPAAPDYSYLPEDVRGEDGLNAEKFRVHYENLAAENAQFKDGRDLVPEDGNYSFNLADGVDFGDLELPEDFEFSIDPEDEAMAPVFGKLSEWMHKHNMPADAAQDAMAMLAEMQAIEVSEIYTAAKADFAKLGSTDSARKARVAKVQRAIETKLPPEQAKAIMAATTSYDGVRAIEALFSAPGPGPIVPQNTNVDLANLPPGERLKVINQMKEAG